LQELREAVATFLKQDAEGHVYWVERAGKAQKNLALKAAPIDIADHLRRRLFGAQTSVIMTSATLSTASRFRVSSTGQDRPEHPARPGGKPAETATAGLSYFARRVGGKVAVTLEGGSPFD